MRPIAIVAAAPVLLLCSMARAQPSPTVEPNALLQKIDEALAPRSFEAQLTMTAHRSDGSTKVYQLRELRSPDGKVRLWFSQPASAAGQEMLRAGDDAWVYLPSLKRALRIESREAFQGGDFMNGDLLHPSLAADYTATRVPSQDAALDALELTARSRSSPCERVLLWVARDTQLPSRSECYNAAGKLARSTRWSDVKELGGRQRPSRVETRNELASGRSSELVMTALKRDVPTPAQLFVLDALGR